MTREPVSVVLPCFNEQDSILGVIEGIADTFKAQGWDFEIVVVNDGSTDETAKRLAASPIPVTLVYHRFNRGYGASLKAGIRAASHEAIIIMDSDGQHPPENLLKLLDAAEQCDMVIGARRNQPSHQWRMPGKLLLKWVSELLAGRRIPDVNSGFRFIRKSEAANYMHLCSDGFSFSTSITLAFLSDRLAVQFVPIDIRPRQGGNSQVQIGTGFGTFMLILRIIGTFNPLRIFMPPTIVMFALGFSYMTWGLIFRHHAGAMAVILMILSVLLFCFGLLADQMSLLRREISKSRS